MSLVWQSENLGVFWRMDDGPRMTAGPLTLVRLALSAPSGLYNVHFKPGVNIIAGPISTGKSSVFQLIDYVFGAQRHPTYEEIAECSDVFLECVVAGQTQTIRRTLHGNDNKARLYDEGIEAIVGGDVSGREVWASYHPSEPTVGREILSRLGLAILK